MGETVGHPGGPVAGEAVPGQAVTGQPDAGPDDGDAWLATFDRWTTFDRWASNLFLLSALVTFLVLLTVVGLSGTTDLPAVLVGLSLAAGALVLGTLVVASAGLDRYLGWARPLARAMLWITVIVTGLGAILDLFQAKFTIPLAAIAALIVLNRWPGPTPPLAARDRVVASLVAGLFLVSIVAGGASGWLASPQSPLIAARDTLQLTVTTNCPDAGLVTSGQPATLVATVRWHWTRHDLVSLAGDGIELTLGLPGDGAWLESGAIRPPAGWSPVVGGAANRLLDTGQSSADLGGFPMLGLSGPRIRYGTKAGGPDTQDGVLIAPLVVNPSQGGADLTLVATYAHAGAWTVDAQTSCTVVAGP